MGSTIQSNGQCAIEVRSACKQGGVGGVSGVICVRRIAARRKGKVYKMVVRPAWMYGLVTVALTRQEFGAKGGRAEDAQIVIGSDQD